MYFSFIFNLLTQSTTIYITTYSQESTVAVLLLGRHLSTPVAASKITPDLCGGHCSGASPVLVGDRYRLTWLVAHNELGDGDCHHLLIIPVEQIQPAMSYPTVVGTKAQKGGCTQLPLSECPTWFHFQRRINNVGGNECLRLKTIEWTYCGQGKKTSLL